MTASKLASADKTESTPFFERLLADATHLLKKWGVYVAALTAAVIAWANFREELNKLPPELGQLDLYKPELVIGLLLLFVLLLKTLPDWRRTRLDLRRREWATSAELPRSGYFRLTPYLAEDHDRFERADGAHEEVLNWLRTTRNPLLFLTGQSGTGKSSLLSAWVVPRLREDKDHPLVMEVRSYVEPAQAIVESLRLPGVVWKQPPDDLSSRALLERACRHLGERRLIVILDQFEEFVVLQGDAKRQPFKDLLRSLRHDPIPGLSLLLSFRSDYLKALCRTLELPAPELDRTWQEIAPFTQVAAEQFLLRSRPGGLNPKLVERVLQEAAEIENHAGLFRPVTLNMLGLVLERYSGPLPKFVEPGAVLRGYLRECLYAPLVRDYAAPILRQMITRFGTKKPLTEIEIALATTIDPIDVSSCLRRLEADGLLRRLEAPAGRAWEIAHDFVARLLAGLLAGWHVSIWRRISPWLAPAAVALWLGGIVLVLPSYVAKLPERAVEQLATFDIFVRNDKEGNLVASGDLPFGSGEQRKVWTSLAQLPRLQTLKLEVGREDIAPLAELKDLQELELSAYGLLDLEPVGELAELQTLRISRSTVSSFNPLGKLKELKVLELDSAELIEPESLGMLTGLRTLKVSGGNLPDLEPLAKLTDLQTLDVSSEVSDLDLEPLGKLLQLRELAIQSRVEVKLDPLSTLTHLNKLTLWCGISDLWPLGRLTELQQLFLYKITGVSDLRPLAGLTELTWLNLSEAFKISDIRPLAELTALDVLTLNDAPDLSDLSPLAALSDLRVLDLGGTGVTDLGPLTGLSALRRLDLSNTPLTDSKKLAGMSKLEDLSLSSTNLTDLSWAANLVELRGLDVSKTRIVNLGPLAGLTALYSLDLSDPRD